MSENTKPLAFLREGNRIIVPATMSLEDAGKAIALKIQEENTEVGVHEEIDAFPLDGAYALMQVLEAKYGFVTAVGTPGMFGKTPPTLVNLEIGWKQNTQVVWGSFTIPGVTGRFQSGSSAKGNRLIFLLKGIILKKHEKEVQEIAELTRKHVQTHSVYKGKAIRLTTDDDGNIDGGNPPSFIDVDSVDETALILPDMVKRQVATSVFAPIEHTATCRKNKIPLKRGVLLAGPYGTGKTLCAYVTAKKCVENGWTFVYLDRVTGLDQALAFTRLYSPAVLFAEDLDRTASGEERTVEIDDVLNTIDGIESKNTEVMAILTTNHVEKINRAMLRPGRLDSVITFQAPDKTAAEKLLRLYARGVIGADQDISKAAELLAGKIPAVIREVVERAKLFAISRTNGKKADLNATDLEEAALEMETHLALMNPKPFVDDSPAAKIGEGLAKIVRDVIGSNGSGSVYRKVEELRETVEQIKANQ